MMPSSAEHRISPRKPLCTRVVFEDELSEEFLYFFSTDISLSGIFIESNIHFQQGTKVFLKFFLREEEPPIQITAEVTRTLASKRKRGRRKKNQKIGIGLRFLALKPEDLLRIEKFVETR